MKRILGLAALLGHALSAATGIQQAYGAARWGGKRNRPYFPATRPNVARWWHDLEQPGQCARLQAAKDKRQQRAEKVSEHAARSVTFNRAHASSYEQFHDELRSFVPDRLNPFYIAK